MTSHAMNSVAERCEVGKSQSWSALEQGHTHAMNSVAERCEAHAQHEEVRGFLFSLQSCAVYFMHAARFTTCTAEIYLQNERAHDAWVGAGAGLVAPSCGAGARAGSLPGRRFDPLRCVRT